MAKAKKNGLYQAGGDVDAVQYEPSREQAQRYARVARTMPRSARIEDRRAMEPVNRELPLDPLYNTVRDAFRPAQSATAQPAPSDMALKLGTGALEDDYQAGGSVRGLGVDPSARPPSTDRRRVLSTVHDVIHHGHYLFGLTGPGTRHPSRSPLHRPKPALGYQYGGDIPEGVQDPMVGPTGIPVPPPPVAPQQVPVPLAESNPWLEMGYAGQPVGQPDPAAPEVVTAPKAAAPKAAAPRVAAEPDESVVPSFLFPGSPTFQPIEPGRERATGTPAGGSAAGVFRQGDEGGILSDFFHALGWAGGAGGNKELLKQYADSVAGNNPNADAADLIAHITKQDTGPNRQYVRGDAANTPEGLANGVMGYQALKDLELKTRSLAKQALQQDHFDNAAELFNKSQNMVPDSFKTTAKVLPDNRFQITREDTLNGPDPRTGQYPTTTHILNKHQMFAFLHGNISELDHQTMHRSQIDDNLRKLAATDVPNMPGQPYGAAGARPYEISRGRYVIGKPEEFTPEQLRGAAVREQFRGLPTLNPYSPAAVQREKEISGAIFPQKERPVIEPDHETAILQHLDRIRKQQASPEGGPPPPQTLLDAAAAIYARHAPGGAAARPAPAAAPARGTGGPMGVPAAAPAAAPAGATNPAAAALANLTAQGQKGRLAADGSIEVEFPPGSGKYKKLLPD